MARYIDKDALVAEIINLKVKYECGWNCAIDKILDYIDDLEVKNPYEQCVQYQIYFLYNAYVFKDDYKSSREETLNTINNSLKGSGILFIGRGCYDNDTFYIINSKDEMIDSINSNCDPEENIYD